MLKYDPITDRVCQPFNGPPHRSGYGKFWVKGRGVVRAPRFAWEAAFGKIPAGLVVCHACDNPTCVNTEHLFLGTKADNHEDMRLKNRDKVGKLTRQQVSDIKARINLWSPGDAKLLAKEFSVTEGTIFHIRRGITWQSI